MTLVAVNPATDTATEIRVIDYSTMNCHNCGNWPTPTCSNDFPMKDAKEHGPCLSWVPIDMYDHPNYPIKFVIKNQPPEGDLL